MASAVSATTDGPHVVGGEEWCALPELGLPWIKARVDSGAHTSALHAWRIRRFVRDGHEWVSFRVHPLQRDRRTVVECEAPLVERRGVKSSSGASEARYVIRTELGVVGNTVPVEVTLTSRDSMGYRMLLGREAMQHGLIVDPSSSFLGPSPSCGALEDAYRRYRASASHLDIGLLGSTPGDPVSSALQKAASARGHHLFLVDINRCEVEFEDHHEHLSCAELPQSGHQDAILPLLPRASAGAAVVLLRHFEHLGAFSPNPARALLDNRERAAAWQRLVRTGAPVPRSSWAPDARRPVSASDSAPILRLCGLGADGNVRIGPAADVGIGRSDSSDGDGSLIQWLPESAPRNLIRCYVAGTRIICVRLRIESDGKPVPDADSKRVLGRTARTTLRRAVRAMGLGLAVVDAFLDAKEIFILEVDPFSLCEIPPDIAITYAEAVIRYLERRAGDTSLFRD